MTQRVRVMAGAPLLAALFSLLVVRGGVDAASDPAAITDVHVVQGGKAFSLPTGVEPGKSFEVKVRVQNQSSTGSDVVRLKGTTEFAGWEQAPPQTFDVQEKVLGPLPPGYDKSVQLTLVAKQPSGLQVKEGELIPVRLRLELLLLPGVEYQGHNSLGPVLMPDLYLQAGKVAGVPDGKHDYKAFLQKVLVAYEQGDASSISGLLCPDFEAIYTGRTPVGAAEFVQSLRGDASNLSFMRLSVRVGPMKPIERSGVEVPLSWQRRASLSADTGEWVRGNCRTTLVIRPSADGSRLELCSVRGDALMALSDATGKLTLQDGTLGGRRLSQPIVVFNGQIDRGPIAGGPTTPDRPTPPSDGDRRPTPPTGADLAIVSLEVQPTTPVMGLPFAVTAVVTNRGPAAVPSATAELTLEGNTLPGRLPRPLQPGGTERITWQVQARSAGRLVLEVTVTPSGVADPQGADNTSRMEVTVSPRSPR